MTRGHGWWLHRLRAMSVAEVAHRSWRLARHPVDRLRMRAGGYARTPAELANWRGPQTFYFGAQLATREASPELVARADQICAGRREILGLGWVALPDPPWHVEPRSGESWPLIDAPRVIAAAPDHFDARLTWEFNRGHEWIVLARVFAATRDVRYRERLAHELASWRRANPIGVGINWASAMEAGIRIHSLAWVAGFMRDDDLAPELAVMLFEHATFVADHLSAFSSANNHLIVELSALAVASRTLGTGGWHVAALERLDAELDRQMFSDGVNAEMATHYHAFVLEALLLVAYLERAFGVPWAKLEATIAGMADYLAALMCDDGSLLQQGDSDDGKIVSLFAEHHAQQLIEAAAALRDAQPLQTPKREREGVFWLTGGRGAAPTPPTRSRAFRPSGQVILRSPRLVASFDAGPFGFGSLAAHAHCDALAINVALDGRRFLVDRGTYRYNGDPTNRDRFRRTAAHNTVQVGTREQAEIAGPFLWSRRPTVTLERCELGDDIDIVQASHDGFAPVVHRRTLVRFDDSLCVLDHVTQRAVVTTRFHFASDFDVSSRSTTSGSLFVITDRATSVVVGWLWIDSQGSRMVRTPHSDRYGISEDASTVECERGVDGAGHLVSAIGPGRFDQGLALANAERAMRLGTGS